MPRTPDWTGGNPYKSFDLFSPRRRLVGSGVTRLDVAESLQVNFNGKQVGLYREENELIPILLRPPEQERVSVENLENLQVWSATTQTFVPIRQVTSGVETQWEWPAIKRRDRLSTITVRCQPVGPLGEPVRQALKDKIEAIELPSGYHFNWAGEFEESQESQAPLAATFPMCLLGMFAIVVWLFNSVRRPLIIFATVPLSIIGVTAGLLITGFPFGFMAILGFLGLSGMLIKNAIVLIDEIELKLKEGIRPYDAVLDSSVSRLRPVIMAARDHHFGDGPVVVRSALLRDGNYDHGWALSGNISDPYYRTGALHHCLPHQSCSTASVVETQKTELITQ